MNLLSISSGAPLTPVLTALATPNPAPQPSTPSNSLEITGDSVALSPQAAASLGENDTLARRNLNNGNGFQRNVSPSDAAHRAYQTSDLSPQDEGTFSAYA